MKNFKDLAGGLIDFLKIGGNFSVEKLKELKNFIILDKLDSFITGLINIKENLTLVEETSQDLKVKAKQLNTGEFSYTICLFF